MGSLGVHLKRACKAGGRHGLYPSFVIAVFVCLQIAAASAAPSTTTYHISVAANGQDCTAIGTWDSGTSTCTLTTNPTVDGVDGIHIESDGVTLDGAGHTLTGNNTAGTRGVYLSGRTGVIVKNLTVTQFGNYGIYLFFSGSNTLSGNSVSSNTFGIISVGASSGYISGNTVSENTYDGIVLQNSSSNTLSGNTVNSNGGYGLYLAESSGNTLSGNTASSNSLGIRLDFSSDNQIYRNIFLNNASQAYVSGGSGNVFNVAMPVGGNYWSDWTTPDSDQNGIVDSAYAFTGGQDNLPWAQQGRLTYHISDTVNGQDCALLGSWDVYTKTCTLTTNVTVNGTDGIQIESDGVILDGAGHVVTGNFTPGTRGIYLSAITGVTIKNLTSGGFEGGIHLSSASGNTISGIGASENSAYGIWLNSASDGNTISGNSARGNGDVGITLEGSGNNILSGNDASNNTSNGISLVGSSNNTLSGNTASSNGISGIWLYYSQTNTLSGNTARLNQDGIKLEGSTANTLSSNTASSNSFRGFYFFSTSDSNTLSGNTASSNSDTGIVLDGSSNNTLSDNTVGSNTYVGIYLGTSSNNNTLSGNTVSLNDSVGIHLYAANNNEIYRNNIISNAIQAYISGGSGNSFNLQLPDGGNFWSDWTTPDSDYDGIVDSPYSFTGGQDDLPWARQNGWQNMPQDYYFTWYDNVGGDNWVLMSNPFGGASLKFNLAIAGQNKSLTGYNNGVIDGGQTITPMFTGVVGGPVVANSQSGGKGIVSQRSLWPKGGNSLEEVLGTDADKLSSHFYWTWYDESPGSGFKNWILVTNPQAAPANPLNLPVQFRIKIAGQVPAGGTGTLQPGQTVTPRFPGLRDGPVEVEAWYDGVGGLQPAKVMASQRVLSNNDMAFNEMPGIPESDLTNSYLWTWYDDLGGSNWVLVANPNPNGLYYEIRVAGQLVAADNGTPIAAEANVTPRFSRTGGPVEVKTFCNAAHTDTALSCSRAIASQRVIWGPSFGEVPGFAYGDLSSSYHWTWYDESAAGVSNWVLIANPGSETVAYQVLVGGVMKTTGTIAGGDRVTPSGLGIGGPVEVRAYVDTGNGWADPANRRDVMASQRVLWKGYFNEVLGTVLD